MQLIGLADTRKVRHCERFSSAAEAIRLVRRNIACTAADDNGALNIWNDKFGKYRCEAMRYYETLESKTFTALTEVRKWAAEWLVKIR